MPRLAARTALPPKEEMDWDAWLAPAPGGPTTPPTRSGGWRNHYDFHTSCIGEWGAHTFAQCQVALGLWNTSPSSTVRRQRQRRRHGDDLRQRREDGPAAWTRRYWHGSCGVRYEARGLGRHRRRLLAAGGLEPRLMGDFKKLVDDYMARTSGR
jgi:hypothetical protein